MNKKEIKEIEFLNNNIENIENEIIKEYFKFKKVMKNKRYVRS